MGVIAAHIIFTAYGFWLPNDPRGSWSDFVASWELLKFGRATKVRTRESLANVPHNQTLRQAAKQSLKYPPVRFSGLQARAIASGFNQAVHEGEYKIYACSILQDHVHLVVGAHERRFEHITRHLKGRATQQLRIEGIYPLAPHLGRDGSVPSVWAGGLWKVFCFDEKHVLNAIQYVEENPLREERKRQSWSFVTAMSS